MAINGIETVIYRVDDLATCTRFFDDFGLSPFERDETHTHYRLDEGSNVVLKHTNDASLPESSLEGLGVVETIWGVDRAEALQKLVLGLERDRSVTRDADGTAHAHDDDGNAFGLRVFRKTPVTSAPDPVNSPGNVNRVNRHRKWLAKARPKTIAHVVYASPDFQKSYEFYRDRLNFRMSDLQKTFGIFLRGDGTIDHHNLYFINAKLPFPHFDGKLRFSHVNYGVEDLDEVMVGTNHMERCGWAKSVWGLGRHRISSALFCYLPCPAGGEAEYGADSDMIDDGWIPRVWNPMFGTAIFMHNIQPWLKEAPPWDVSFADGHAPAHAAMLPPGNSE
jgi:catechol 2,3-dioxygenase-like lactoylglutathione lyase family enzyme